jgi:transforming growth factor-beta-induced protein
VLRDVLEYHVIAGAAVRSTQLTAGPVETVGGEDIAVTTAGGIRLNGSVSVLTADVEATNGIVHVVDAVLVPPTIVPIVGTIVAPAYFNKNFTTLIAAVNAASPSILQALLAAGDKTLFAPTNEAFEEAGITTLPDQATLNAVLQYHVIAGAEVFAADIENGSSSAETLNGNIYLSKGESGVFINGTTEVIATDITASNGVVHVIDRTLLPPSQTIADIAIDFSDNAEPEFTQLVAALLKVPTLLEAADAEGNLTVFAPTDAAFEALYTALGVEDMDELEAAIGNEKLAEVLQHHIVGARVFSTDLSSGAVTTLNQDITVNLTNLTITDGNGSTPATGLVPSLLNVHATNGVIHVIDKVLIPDGIL